MEWFTALIVIVHITSSSSSQAVHPASDPLLKLQDKCILQNNVWVLWCTRSPGVALTLDLYYRDPYQDGNLALGQCPETGNCTCRNPTSCTVNSNDTFVELRLTGEQNQPVKLVCNPLGRDPVTVNCTSDEEQEVKQFLYIIIIIPSIGIFFICCVVCWRYKATWLKMFKKPEHVKDGNSQDVEPERQSLTQYKDDGKSISQTSFKDDRDLRQNAIDSASDLQSSAVPETPWDVLESVQSNVQQLEIAQNADGQCLPIKVSDTELNQPCSIAEGMTAQSRAATAQPEEQNAIKLPFYETGRGIPFGEIESNGAVIFRVREQRTDSDRSPETDVPFRRARRGGCRNPPHNVL